MDKIRQLAHKWGTSISNRTCFDGFAFNGKTIARYEDRDKRRERSDSNLIHDIAHFVVADPARKTIPEFGLGDSPDTKIRNTPLAKGLTYRMAQQEEELASALGIYWERELGLDWRDTFSYHTWDDVVLDIPEEEKEIFNFEATHKFAQRLKELKERKII